MKPKARLCINQKQEDLMKYPNKINERNKNQQAVLTTTNHKSSNSKFQSYNANSVKKENAIFTATV